MNWKMQFLVTFLFLCILNNIYAQDYIVRKSGEIVECKIIRIDSTHIYLDISRDGRTFNTMVVLDDVSTYQFGGRRPLHSSVITIDQDQLRIVDGSIVHGTIVEQVPNQRLTIRTSDGVLHTYQLTEIESISKVELGIMDYGGKRSVGFSLLGYGILGMPVRYYPNPETALELGINLRPFIMPLERTEVSLGLSFSAGASFFGPRKNNTYKRKILQDGVSINAGYGFQFSHDIQEAMLTINWIRERFRYESKKNSFILELGAGIKYTSPFYKEVRIHDPGYIRYVVYETRRYAPIINLRLLWNEYF